jgi:chromate reductase, NAD(P)H dehydrogenase (quinone)
VEHPMSPLSEHASALQVLGLSGSLRQRSYNTAALRAAQRLAPSRMAIDIAPLRDIPPYDEDVKQAGFPMAVNELRSKVRAADALLLATPEYNYSYSGVLKNAIDWISRPPDQPFADKPIALMSASPGLLGGARAQYHLRQCFIFLDARLMSRPEIMIAQADQRFDDAGELTDETTAQLLGKMLADFAAWIDRIRSSRAV